MNNQNADREDGSSGHAACFKLGARYTFEAAHQLPNLPDGHKCKRLHGHNWQVEVSVFGTADARGFVIDYAELDAIVDPLVAQLDHRLLNEIAGLENPTSEVVSAWLHKHIAAGLPPLLASSLVVRLYETPRYWIEAAG